MAPIAGKAVLGGLAGVLLIALMISLMAPFQNKMAAQPVEEASEEVLSKSVTSELRSNPPVADAAARFRFAVQVGAYRHRSRAATQARSVTSLSGHTAHAAAAAVRGQTYYRVRIPVDTHAEARALAARLEREQNLETWIPITWVARYRPVPASYEKGTASWYGHPFHGRQTASGETYDMHQLTAAHPSLPLGTRVRVKNLTNGNSVRLRVNDRGPYAEWEGIVYYRGERAIDLSYAAAVALDMVEDGLAPVEIAILNDSR
jgi:rare lipoprotein A (peptidoglycan hydrolase)